MKPCRVRGRARRGKAVAELASVLRQFVRLEEETAKNSYQVRGVPWSDAEWKKADPYYFALVQKARAALRLARDPERT